MNTDNHTLSKPDTNTNFDSYSPQKHQLLEDVPNLSRL